MNLSPERRKIVSKWIIGIVAACILIFLGVQNIDIVASAVSWAMNLIMPLILGLVFALILNVPMRSLEAHLFKKAKKPFLKKLRRPIALIISFILILGIIAGIVSLLIPELVKAFKVIIDGAVNFAGTISAMSPEELSARPLGSLLLNIEWDKMLTTMQNWFKNQSGNIMNTAVGTIGSVVGGVFDFFIAIVFAVYILFGKEKLKRQIVRLIRVWIPEKVGSWTLHACSVISENFRNFILGQSLDAVILGSLCMIGMLIIGIPYAPMVGALVGVTALIPVVGAFIGAIVGAFMILTVDPIKAVVFVIFLVILQQLEGNIVYPKIMGSRVNLPGMWVLAAVTIGGGIAGPVGMLLSVPVASTAYVLFREATTEREKSQKKEEPTEE